MSDIKTELEEEIRKRKRLGFTNYWISNLSLLAAVACSLFPLLNEALPDTRQFSSDWIPLISAIPAAIIFVLTIFKFEDKQNYHWLYARKTRVIQRMLRDQKIDASDVSKKYSKLTVELGELYPGSTIVSGFRGAKGA